MDFLDHSLDDSHRAIRDSARRFARQSIAPHVEEWEEAELFPCELYQAAAAAGVLAVGFPEEVGGGGGGMLHMMMIIEGLLEGGSSGVVAGLGSLGIALPAIVQAGDRAQIDQFVRPTLLGERIAALAVTEAGTGSDVAGIRTRARRDGGDYLIDGDKMFITSGARADFVTVLARTGEEHGKHHNLSFFVVERGMPGFSVSRSLRKTGWRASDTAALSFEGVRVPAANRIGEEGGAFLTLMRNFATERLMLAAFGHATARIALADARSWAEERHAFGKKLSAMPVIRHKLASMATRVTAATTLNYAVAGCIDAGESCVSEVAMAKNLSAETAVSVCYDAVQILGGMGYMRETRVERLSRDARLLPIGGGTTEIMNEIIIKMGT